MFSTCIVILMFARIPWRPPKWVSPFQCLRVQQGNEAMFVGQISGLPAPSIQWTWRGLPLEAGDKGRKTWYDEDTGRVCLVIPDLGPGDEGDYMCRADNPYGDSTCTITVSWAEFKQLYNRLTKIFQFRQNDKSFQHIFNSLFLSSNASISF